MEQLLNSLSSSITSNIWVGPILAFFAGIITSITPCALSSVPLIIGYVGAKEEKNTKRAFTLSLIFALGLAVTFSTLGVIAATAGSFFGNYSKIWLIFLGILMILMALQMAEIFNIIPANNLMAKNTKKGAFGAFILGILGGFFSSPCSTPVLILLMGIIATKGSLFLGILLMAFYSIGYSMLTVVAGTSVGFVQNLKSSSKYRGASQVLKYLLAAIMLCLGFYLIYEAI